MKLSKRMLAVLCTLLMLASCFALPYGALAAEDASESASSLPYRTVGRLQAEGEVWTQTTGHTFGNLTFASSAPIALNNWSNYMIAMEVKMTQDFGFTSTDWMNKVCNGNLSVTDAAGTATTLSGNPMQQYIPKEMRVEGEWMQLYVSLSAMPTPANGNYGITNMKLLFYNDTAGYSEGGITGDNNDGVAVSIRNVQVLDMSRNADGGISETVATFGRQDVVVSTSFTGGGLVDIVPRTDLFYSNITSDMAVADLNLEFDIMYEGDADATGSLIRNGQVRLFTGTNYTEHQGYNNWGTSIAKAGEWYHFSFPLSGFNALTDPTALSRVYLFNYNDSGKPFTAKAKNIKITYAPVTNVLKALEEAKNFVYDVDENATAYEKALADCRALFTSETATYADFATALAALNTAKAGVTNGRNMVKEVGHISGAESTYTNTRANSSGSCIATDWKSVGASLDLTDGKTYTAVAGTSPAIRGAIGANRYLTAKVTISRNEAYTGSLALAEGATLPKVTYLDINLRSSNATDTSVDTNTERRTNPYKMYPVGTPTVNADGSVTQTMELLLDDSSNTWTDNEKYDRRVDWADIVSANMWWYFDAQIAEKANNSDTNIVLSVDELKFVNKTADFIEADLKEAAEGYIAPGKYTAESTAEYLTYKEQAQAMLEDDAATLQEKMQLIAKVNAAKTKFVPVITEYVQFGGGSFASAGGFKDITLQASSNTLPATMTDEEFAKLCLRVEVMAERTGDYAGVANAYVNGGVRLRKTDNSYPASKGFGDYTNSILGDAYSGEWVTRYYTMSDLGYTSFADLANINNVYFYGYNDLSKKSHNTIRDVVTTDSQATVYFRNVAIIDNTNVAAVEDLKNLFTDVTKDGTVEFTPASYAAYKAVYDEWYNKAYATVDLTQYEAAKAAMEAAYAGLVCVDKVVADLSGFNGESNASKGHMIRRYTFDPADLTIRNRDNLVLRFTLTYTGVTNGLTPPTDLVAELKDSGLSLFNTDDTKVQKYYTYQLGDNVMEIPLTQFDANGALKTINQIELFGYAKENAPGATTNDAASTQDYKFIISNAELVDTTKDLMKADLKAKAETDLDELGVFDAASAADYIAAQEAALEIVAKDDPTYAEMEVALKAFDDAAAKLVTVGHNVMTFSNFAKDVKNFMYSNAMGVYMDWRTADQGETDLSKYNKANLALRINFYVGTTDPENYPVPATVTLSNNRLALASKVSGEGEKCLNFSNYNGTYDSQNGFIEIPFTKAADAGINWNYVKDIIWYVSVAEFANDTSANQANGSGHYYINATSARIVDTTPEKNLGTVETVGSGRVDIAGGMNYGKADVLTATKINPAATFVGYRYNDQFVTTETLENVKVSGNEEITAYFVGADETAVVYYGKYNRVVDVQVVKSADALTAPAQPAITGQVSNGWEPVEYLNLGGTTPVMALYTPDTTNTYSVTLEGTTNDTTLEKGFDNGVTVTAKEAEAGMKFAYWTINNAVASYDATLTFYVSGDMTVKAVFVAEDEAVSAELSAGISQATMVAGEPFTFAVIGQTYLPEGYELMEYGVIFAPTEDDLTSMTENTLKVTSSSRIANRQYQINLLKVKAGKNRSAMAYITAVNAEGEVVTAYSTIATKTAE